MAVSTLNLQAGSLTTGLLGKAAGLSSTANIEAARVSLPCRLAVVRKGQGVVQAKVKRKAEAGAPVKKLDAKSVEVLRTPWAAVAAASALAALGASDQSSYANMRPIEDHNAVPLEAAAANDDTHALSAASLSAPILAYGGDELDAEGVLPVRSPEVLLYYEPAEPLQPTFNPDDFRAKLPDGAGPLGGGEWQFSSMKTSGRSCPAWGSNQNIEMVVPGAAKPLQVHPPRGSKRWFASFPEADTSQLQGGDVASALEDRDWGYLEVANPGEKSASQEEVSEVPVVGKNPFEGLIIEIVRMPVFSCFSL
ncbi:hypothetical protein KFL_002080100 [Klebsormidium nitens]|uniref:Uncharacterized protein n=1 Tax=Klebsormidium nitens TaxID=105231 RepID=A0A1Y1I2Y7_KLENI|nr:hypothetical protein KFL_002080100 [Klebsormidium nitens]|eukprot:GAQ84833.1 hypothetical protein KFL_002080100 [Klebsormidium nitens]